MEAPRRPSGAPDRVGGPPVTGLGAYYLHRADFADSVAEFFSAPAEAAAIHSRQGSIKLMDALVLYELLREERPASVLEIGSFLGFSTRWILAATEPFGSRVTALDPGIPHRIFADVAGHLRGYCASYADRLTVRQAFLSAVNTDQFVANILRQRHWPGDAAAILARLEAIEVVTQPFDTFDFAFVDGDHSFRATVENVLLVARMIRPGGTVVVHDAVTWKQVLPALEALEIAADGALELLGIEGAALHADMQPHFAERMTPQNALYACNAFCNGMGVLRVQSAIADPDRVQRTAMKFSPA